MCLVQILAQSLQQRLPSAQSLSLGVSHAPNTLALATQTELRPELFIVGGDEGVREVQRRWSGVGRWERVEWVDVPRWGEGAHTRCFDQGMIYISRLYSNSVRSSRPSLPASQDKDGRGQPELSDPPALRADPTLVTSVEDMPHLEAAARVSVQTLTRSIAQLVGLDKVKEEVKRARVDRATPDRFAVVMGVRFFSRILVWMILMR